MRILLKEITATRLFEAIYRRINNIPVKIKWKYSEAGKVNNYNLKKYKNIHQGKRCFIIANGPSLAKMDLSPLKNEITFGMNRIYLLFDKLNFTPNYYVVSNELVLEQFSEDIKQIKSDKFLNWDRKNLFNASEKINFLKLFLAINEKFSENVEDGVYSGGTVTHVTLQLAYYMGFKEVYIIGLDHNFTEKGIPSKTEVRTADEDKSHFHPNYFPKGIKWQLPDLYRSELAYKYALSAFKNDNRSVFDATVDGKCTVFPKIDFNSIFSNDSIYV